MPLIPGNIGRKLAWAVRVRQGGGGGPDDACIRSQAWRQEKPGYRFSAVPSFTRKNSVPETKAYHTNTEAVLSLPTTILFLVE